MSSSDAFAFAAKRQAITERSGCGMPQKAFTSDNGHYVAFACLGVTVGACPCSSYRGCTQNIQVERDGAGSSVGGHTRAGVRGACVGPIPGRQAVMERFEAGPVALQHLFIGRPHG